MGDWGGQEKPPFTSDIQINVAAAMKTIADKKNIHAIFSTGDNFYYHGVNSSHDTRFKVFW